MQASEPVLTMGEDLSATADVVEPSNGMRLGSKLVWYELGRRKRRRRRRRRKRRRRRGRRTKRRRKRKRRRSGRRRMGIRLSNGDEALSTHKLYEQRRRRSSSEKEHKWNVSPF